jgi:hypothetical protein
MMVEASGQTVEGLVCEIGKEARDGSKVRDPTIRVRVRERDADDVQEIDHVEN